MQQRVAQRWQGALDQTQQIGPVAAAGFSGVGAARPAGGGGTEKPLLEDMEERRSEELSECAPSL